MKVYPSKEETPAHSRHPLPPIFLSPSSSRYLKVIGIGGGHSKIRTFAGAEDGNSSEPMEEEGGHVPTAGTFLVRKKCRYKELEAHQLKSVGKISQSTSH